MFKGSWKPNFSGVAIEVFSATSHIVSDSEQNITILKKSRHTLVYKAPQMLYYLRYCVEVWGNTCTRRKCNVKSQNVKCTQIYTGNTYTYTIHNIYCKADI